ncbi:MAG: SDR family NAD(P)-dependent oxidoreductase, partial [Dermatophilaceae bacterium]
MTTTTPTDTTDSSLTGRRAVVTGSTSGIGAATARLLAAQGARVVVTGRDRTRGQEVVDSILRDHGWATFVAADLAGPSDDLRAAAMAWTRALDGGVDILVHNAAVCPAVDTANLSDEELETALQVNVRAPHVLTAALVPSMIEQGGGAIVVIGSWMASVGHPFVGLYSATKAAAAQLARSWAAEFGPSGIRVNTIAPGATRTPVNDGADEVVVRMTAGTPAGRPGRP